MTEQKEIEKVLRDEKKHGGEIKDAGYYLTEGAAALARWRGKGTVDLDKGEAVELSARMQADLEALKATADITTEQIRIIAATALSENIAVIIEIMRNGSESKRLEAFKVLLQAAQGGDGGGGRGGGKARVSVENDGHVTLEWES